MVWKRSKHGCNTGNTLRRSWLVQDAVKQFSRGTILCHFDEVKISNSLDHLHKSAFDSVSSGRSYDYEAAYMYRILGMVVEIHEEMQLHTPGVTYSLSKCNRWKLFETVVPLLKDLNQSSNEVEGIDFTAKAFERFGYWDLRKHMLVIPNRQAKIADDVCINRKQLIRRHDRGIQRLNRKKEKRSSPLLKTDDSVWESSSTCEESSSSRGSYDPDIEYEISRAGNFGKLFSRVKNDVNDGGFPKGKRRGKVIHWSETVGFKGHSATDCIHEEFDMPHRKRVPFTHCGQYEKETKRKSKNFFLTECTEAEEKKKTLPTKAKPVENKTAEKTYPLWQLISEMIDESSAQSATVTMKRCKKNASCSRINGVSTKEKKAQLRLKAEEFSEKERSDGYPQNGMECSDRSVVADSRKRTRTKVRSNKKDYELFDAHDVAAVQCKVRSCDIIPINLATVYNADYSEATCLPRVFWLNMSNKLSMPNVASASGGRDDDSGPNDSDDKLHQVGSSQTDCQQDCLHNWSCFLLFVEMSGDVMQGALSTEADEQLSYRNVCVTIKTVWDSPCVENAHNRLSASLDSQSVNSLSSIVASAETVIREFDALWRLSTKPVMSCCPRVSRGLLSRLDWMKSLCNWQFDIHLPATYSSLLTNPALMPTPRTVATPLPPRRLSAITLRNAADDTCSLCRRPLKARVSSSRALSRNERKASLVDAASADRNSFVKYRLLTGCQHGFCLSCLCDAFEKRFKDNEATEKCLVDGCWNNFDSVTLLSFVTLAKFRGNLRRVLDNKLKSYPQWKRCPNSSCHRAVKVSGSCLLRETVTISCHCGTEWCFHCTMESHWPASCKDNSVYQSYRQMEGIDSDCPLFTVESDKSCTANIALKSANRKKEEKNAASEKVPAIDETHHKHSANGVRTKASGPSAITVLNGLVKRRLPSIQSLRPFYCGLPNWVLSRPTAFGSAEKKRTLPQIPSSRAGSANENNAAERKTSAKELSTNWELCTHCHDLPDSGLAVPTELVGQRCQPLGQIRTAILPILIYRSAINHRSRRRMWSRPEVEIAAKLLAVQLQKRRSNVYRMSVDGSRLRATAASTDNSSSNQQLQPIVLYQSGVGSVHKRQFDAQVLNETVFIISVHQFVEQVHTLLEYVYVALLSKPVPDEIPRSKEQLCSALRLEAIVHSMNELLDGKPASRSVNVVASLQSLLSVGQVVFNKLASNAAGVPAAEPPHELSLSLAVTS